MQGKQQRRGHLGTNGMCHTVAVRKVIKAHAHSPLQSRPMPHCPMQPLNTFLQCLRQNLPTPPDPSLPSPTLSPPSPYPMNSTVLPLPIPHRPCLLGVHSRMVPFSQNPPEQGQQPLPQVAQPYWVAHRAPRPSTQANYLVHFWLPSSQPHAAPLHWTTKGL